MTGALSRSHRQLMPKSLQIVRDVNVSGRERIITGAEN